MGLTRGDIKRIFRTQGLYIGLIGCGLGGGLGLGLSWLQHQYGLLRLSSAFIIDAYPVAVDVSDIAIILIGGMLLGIAVGWHASLRAARVQLADAVRYVLNLLAVG